MWPFKTKKNPKNLTADLARRQAIASKNGIIKAKIQKNLESIQEDVDRGRYKHTVCMSNDHYIGYFTERELLRERLKELDMLLEDHKEVSFILKHNNDVDKYFSNNEVRHDVLWSLVVYKGFTIDVKFKMIGSNKSEMCYIVRW